MSVKVGIKYIDIWKESMEDEVLEYEKEPIETGKIVFYGSSTFTRWSKKFGKRPLSECLLGKSGNKCAINRGFGSTCAEHQLYYYPRMIRPLAPSVLVYIPFGNYASFGYTVEENWELAQRVLAYAKTDFPDIKIYLCPTNPIKKERSQKTINDIEKSIEFMREYCEANSHCKLIDISWHEEFNTRKDIFVEDGVHLNQEGYDMYEKIIRKALREELDKF